MRSGRRRLIHANGVAFTGEVKLSERQLAAKEKPAPRYPTSDSRAARAELPAPLERIGDPQIPLTRPFFEVPPKQFGRSFFLSV